MLEGSATLAKSYSAPIASAQFDWRCHQFEDVGPKAIATATVTLNTHSIAIARYANDNELDLGAQ